MDTIGLHFIFAGINISLYRVGFDFKYSVRLMNNLTPGGVRVSMEEAHSDQ
ncbi:MAG: hypothetical protein ACI8P3_002535 [Saprospiraceae bacterium]|jgi:hypothetical protein